MASDNETHTEEQLLAEARERIKEVRRGELLIRVESPAHTPVVGATVEVEQTGSDFLFGCNIYMFERFGSPALDQVYKDRFRDLFNYATLPFYWRSYERERGTPNYEYTDRIAAWCQEQGIVTKGHPLVWTHRAGTPDWLPGEPNSLTQLVQRRVSDIVSRYRGTIDRWDVVNEPIHTPPFGNWTALEHVARPLHHAREANPEAQLVVNEYYMFARPQDRSKFHSLLQQLTAADAPFDAIGLQAHEPAHYRFSAQEALETLNAYADFGKPLHITEFVPASDGEPTTGYRHAQTWSEEEQADFAVAFYTLCFSHPSVEAITWWDLSERGAWRTGGSLCRADLSPKPVYVALKKLLHEDWRTRGSGRTNGTGTFRIRGFTGTYTCRVTWEGVSKERTVVLPRSGGQLTLVFP